MADELRSIGDAVGTEPLRAAANAARGVMLAAADQLVEARHALEEAIARYEAGGEQYELARTRVDLARVLDALGRRASALTEASAAAESLSKRATASGISSISRRICVFSAVMTGLPFRLQDRSVSVLRQNHRRHRDRWSG